MALKSSPSDSNLWSRFNTPHFKALVNVVVLISLMWDGDIIFLTNPE